MAGFLTSAGKLMLTTTGKVLLFATAADIPFVPPTLLSTVAGMSAWWDAGTGVNVLCAAWGV